MLDRSYFVLARLKLINVPVKLYSTLICAMYCAIRSHIIVVALCVCVCVCIYDAMCALDLLWLRWAFLLFIFFLCLFGTIHKHIGLFLYRSPMYDKWQVSTLDIWITCSLRLYRSLPNLVFSSPLTILLIHRKPNTLLWFEWNCLR